MKKMKKSLVSWCLSEKLINFLTDTVQNLRTGSWELKLQWGKCPQGESCPKWAARGCRLDTWVSRRQWTPKPGKAGGGMQQTLLILVRAELPIPLSPFQWFYSGRQCVRYKNHFFRFPCNLGCLTHSGLVKVLGLESFVKHVRLS